MKRIFLMFIAFSAIINFAVAESDEILMTIGDKKITKGEFEYIYFKNNDRDSVTEDDLKDYLDMFINFKLKVLEAESRGMDSTQAFIKELDGYREQLTRPYLTDRSVDEFYMQEAYQRLTEEVKVSHILIEIGGSKTDTDTLAAYNKALEVREKLLAGVNFANLAKEYSIDPSAADNGGLLGYFKGFQMIYPFESAAFNTPVGEISMPVKTQFGYHILRVEDRRPAQGEVLVAHIMKMTPKEATDEQVQKAKEQIDEIYEKLINGENFSELAKTASDDYGSAKNGGSLNWFSTGNMVREFEHAAFALKEKGDISQPVKTQFGWHILKLLDKRGVRSYNESKEEIKRRLQRDPRGSKAFENFVAQLKKDYGYKEYENNINEFIELSRLYTYQDSMFKVVTRGLMKPVMTLDGIDYSQESFANYLIRNPRSETPNENERVKLKWDKFQVETIVDYEKSRLEVKYPEFKYLMKEYHDGILLFEISSQEVWNKASEDEDALKAFHAKVKKKYKWDEPHYKGQIVRCENDSVMAVAQELFKKNVEASDILKTMNEVRSAVSIEKGSFVKGENDVVDYYHFGGEMYKPYLHYKSAFLVGKLNKSGVVKEFDQVKGSVTSDYQNHLEKQWVKALRKKFKTSVNKDVFKTIVVNN